MADIETSRRLIREKRDEWRRVRAGRLRRKEDLEAGGFSAAQIRRDGKYKSLLKKQKCLSKEIRHIEGHLNRRAARNRNAGADGR